MANIIIPNTADQLASIDKYLEELRKRMYHVIKYGGYVVHTDSDLLNFHSTERIGVRVEIELRMKHDNLEEYRQQFPRR